MRTPLSDAWTVRAVGGPVPAELADRRVLAAVPGCVHTDLLAAGLIPDPYLDQNEALLTWIGRVDWCYETDFDWDGVHGNVDLVAHGLDTIATVRLNDVVIGETANMHRTHRFQVGEALRRGRNRLSITFAAGVDAAEQLSEQLGPRPYVNAHPFNAIRKMAANYGWDWGPDVVTAGIWRPIALESWCVARLQSVRPLVSVDDTSGVVEACVALDRDAGTDRPLDLRVDVGGHSADAVIAAGVTEAVVRIVVPAVDVWWPHDMGDQPLYPVRVTLSDAGTQLDAWDGRVGFRTVALDVEPDEHGTSFALRINGVPIFSRGVNWIPEDCFPGRVDRDRYLRRLRQARDANVNLVRVWGGGIYESDDFYDVCDELGLLVWQDFLFACAAYAEEEPLRGEVIAEAREAVTRLSPHPSLVLWNGCNENIWGHADWGWQDALAGRTWGAGYYTEVLPAIVAELDPTRPYCPGSPFSPSPDQHPNDPAHATMHIWDVWNELDYTAYRDYVPRFVAEFGFQGPATAATIARTVHDVPLVPDSPGMLAHQKADDGQDKLARGLKAHLPVPADFDDWHWATSLNQARAVAVGIEHFRSLRPVCMGAVVWQLNDCWPVTSWSAIDGDGRRKPLWYALRRSFRARLLTVQPRADGLALVAVNDDVAAWHEQVHVRRVDFDGTVLASAQLSIDADAGDAVTVALPAELATPGRRDRELVVADGRSGRAVWAFADDIDAALPAAEYDCSVEAVEGGYRLVVTARTVLRDLAVLADRVSPDAEVDDMLVTLLPGESATFELRSVPVADPAVFTAARVLRSANQLVARSTRANAAMRSESAIP